MKKIFYFGIFLFCGMSCLTAGDKSYYNWRVEVIGYKAMESSETTKIKKRKKIKVKRKKIIVGGTREQAIKDAEKRFLALYPNYKVDITSTPYIIGQFDSSRSTFSESKTENINK